MGIAVKSIRRDLPDQGEPRYTVTFAVAAVRPSEVSRNTVREETSMAAPQSWANRTTVSTPSPAPAGDPVTGSPSPPAGVC